MAQTQSEKPPTPAQQAGPTSPERDPAGSKNEQNAGSDTDPIAMLRADHRRVEQLFGSFEKASSAEQKSQLAKQICTELIIHPNSGSWSRIASPYGVSVRLLRAGSGRL
jgi:hypothetical protein